MAGAVEVHAHVAGPKVNKGRNYRPEDKLFTYTPTKGSPDGRWILYPDNLQDRIRVCQDGIHHRHGSSNASDLARHVHEEIKDTPIIDEAAFPVFGNNWFVFEYLKNNEMDNMAYISWLMKTTKGYAVKIVNPGGSEAWGWGLNCLSVNDPVPYFDITPAEIVKGLMTPTKTWVSRTQSTSTPTISETLETMRPPLTP